jgi:hypothetical protein
MPEDSQKQQRHSDQELAASLGEDIGLGEVRLTARARAYRPVAVFGGTLAFVAAVMGLVMADIFTGSAKVIDAAVFGGLFLLGCLLLGLGTARSPVTSRLFWYNGGLVQLNSDEPEPHMLRWADVETATVFYEWSEQVHTRLTGCVLRGGTGTKPIDINSGRQTGKYPYRILRDLTLETASVLAPRLVPPLIGIYESGEPVIFGNVRVDQAGITADGSGFGHIAWRWDEIGSISTYHARKLTGTPSIDGIRISKHAANIWTGINPSGVPNGMFLPHLLAYAAAQNGVPLHTQPAGLLAQWRAFSR